MAVKSNSGNGEKIITGVRRKGKATKQKNKNKASKSIYRGQGHN